MLTELRLAEVEKLDDDSLKFLHGLTHLTYLDLSRAGLTGEALTDDGVVPLLEHVGSNIKTLILNNNHNLGDRTLLKGIRPHCAVLRHLGLRDVAEILPTGVVGLFGDWSANDGLEFLDISRCLEINDAGIAALIEHSGKTLVTLNINSVDKDLTEEGLKSIAGNCDLLERLDLGFVRAVDDFLLKDIMDKCPSLKWVSVFGCNRVTDFAPTKQGVKIVGGEGNFRVD